jgi:hypothetical protein
MTHSSTKVATLHMSINLPNPASDTVSGVGKIGSRGINTKDGFMWISELEMKFPCKLNVSGISLSQKRLVGTERKGTRGFRVQILQPLEMKFPCKLNVSGIS